MSDLDRMFGEYNPDVDPYELDPVEAALAETDVLVAAIMPDDRGEDGALVILHGEKGVVGRIGLDRREVKLAEAPEIHVRDIVNTDAVKAADAGDFLATGEIERHDEADDRDEYGNRPQPLSAITTTQAENLARPGYTIGHGGGSGGTGKAKEAKFEPKIHPDGREWSKDYTRLKIRGLTLGELDYYQRLGNASDEARGVLRRYVAALEMDHTIGQRLDGPKAKATARDLTVYGLTEYEIDVLRVRGNITKVLSDYARDRAGSRIEAIDREHRERTRKTAA
jgi:hypothetical protein